MAKCPQCNVAMVEVALRADPGTLIQLDQCGECGGIWCDKWELFPIDPGEAKRVDGIDGGLLRTPVEFSKRSLYCPRCTAPLEECKDPVLPAELVFDRCLRCEGIWLNRGELLSYKDHQRAIQLKNLSAHAMIQKLPEVYDNPKSWIVKGTRGMMAYPGGIDDSAEDLKPSLSRALGTILQILMRATLGI